MIISHKYKFIFIKTVKTAGTSIEVYLSAHCAMSDVVTPIYPHVEPHIARNHKGLWNPFPELVLDKGMGRRRCIEDLLLARKFYNHIPGTVIRERVPNKIWETYYKFCVERNPFDKTLSHYHMANARSDSGMTFDEYMERGRFCLNYPKYTDKNNNVIVDKVIKFESLRDELKLVFGELGIPYDGILGVSAKENYRQDRRPYQEVIGDMHRKKLEQIFDWELQTHGYSY